MNMRAQPKLISWQLRAPFFVAPGSACVPSSRQSSYLLLGGGLLLTAERRYFRLAASRGWVAPGQQFTTDLLMQDLPGGLSGRSAA
jgi:hypothetical protein